MNHSWRKKLKARYRQSVNAAVHNALDGTQSSLLKEDVQQLENYSKLLDHTQRHWTADSGLAIIVALLCIVAASLLWSKHVPHTSISLTAETESLQGDVTENWHVDSVFQSGLMHFERLSKIRAPNLGLSFDGNQGDAWMRLEGGELSLESLALDNGGSVQMASDKDQVSFFLSRKPVRGKVIVVGACTVTAGERADEKSFTRRFEVAVPETVEFEVSDPTEVPSRITIHHPRKWNLGKVPLANVNFAVEEIRGLTETEFKSGTKSGFIRFTDTSWPTLEVSENELLVVHQTERAAIEVRSADPFMHVTLNGAVRNVTVGHGEARRELAPSYLEYLYNKKTLAFFWGAVAFAWGILWGIRKTIFR